MLAGTLLNRIQDDIDLMQKVVLAKHLSTAIKVKGNPDVEKRHLIYQLLEDDKQTVYKIIETTHIKPKYQTFSEKNL